MTTGADERPGWVYYGAIALFVGILGFAILGLVRSSSLVGAAPSNRAPSERQPTKPAPRSILSAGRPPTVEIPPPTASVATPPPSRTYVHPPPEGEGVYTDPGPDLRR